MKKIFTFILLGALSVGLLAGCSDSSTDELVDGTYRAEFKECDDYGWKDFVELTVKDGELYEVVFDGENEDCTKLKSEDESYENQMKEIVGTYPAKYNKDLINQFLSSGKVSKVDIVAGATESTGNFKTLIMAAMEKAMDGDTELSVVDNIQRN